MEVHALIVKVRVKSRMDEKLKCGKGKESLFNRSRMRDKEIWERNVRKRMVLMTPLEYAFLTYLSESKK
jgi:hypothetical protein